MSEFNFKKFLTEEEDRHLARLLKTEKTRDTLMLEMLRKYGMRQNEILRLRYCDINQDAKTMKVHGSKGSVSRELPLTDEFYGRLMEDYELRLDDNQRIFQIGRHALQRAWRWYRPCRKGLHSLRHTCAIEIYKKTRDIHLVRNLLGHKSINNTLIYLQFVQSQEEFRRVLVG